MTTKQALENFAVNVYVNRKRLGMSIYQLAKITGISVATLSFIEKGKRLPSLRTALEISKKLDVDMNRMIDTPILSENF